MVELAMNSRQTQTEDKVDKENKRNDETKINAIINGPTTENTSK